MSNAAELPPLPDPDPASSVYTECGAEDLRAYGRACQATLLAKLAEQEKEIERLKQKLAGYHSHEHYYERAQSAERERDELRAKLEAAQKALQQIAEWDGELSAQEFFFIARKAIGA